MKKVLKKKAQAKKIAVGAMTMTDLQVVGKGSAQPPVPRQHPGQCAKWGH